jgi:hypothetical protein
VSEVGVLYDSALKKTGQWWKILAVAAGILSEGVSLFAPDQEDRAQGDFPNFMLPVPKPAKPIPPEK